MCTSCVLDAAGREHPRRIALLESVWRDCCNSPQPFASLSFSAGQRDSSKLQTRAKLPSACLSL